MSSTDKTSGGAVALIRPVTDFYGRVLSSPRLAHHFEGSAIEVLISKQTAFIAAVLSRESRYSPEELERVHGRFFVTDVEFDELISLLKSSLDDHQVAPEQTSLIVSTFENFRDSIVKRPVPSSAG